ncbi:Protein argonaute-4, partial [Stylosanthes scabra]|nr:Protein argonaute-4 [Stylosanthes scabra]
MKLWFRAGRNHAGVDSPTDGEKKKMRRQSQSKTIKVVISYAANIPIQAITDAISVQNYQGSMQQSRAVSSFADPSTTAIQMIIRTYEVVFKAAEVSIQVSVPLKEAKRVPKSLIIRVNNMEYKISGLSKNPCRSQLRKVNVEETGRLGTNGQMMARER